jgi:L-tartrate/succinate antiporter
MVLMLAALVCWMFGGRWINPTITGLGVVVLLLVSGVIRWAHVLAAHAAWTIMVWVATLIALSGGLNRTGFIAWFASRNAPHLASVPPIAALVAMLVLFFVVHYLFASVTAQTTAMFPMMLSVGAAIPGFPITAAALLLSLELGFIGIISPYGSGAATVYYGSGYVPPKDFWRLGALFGVFFLIVFLLVDVPWVLYISR